MTSPEPPVLSVLDLAPVGRGYTPAEALAASVRLAQEAERLGYHRLWVAEHHNMPGIASSSPPVLIAHLAANTTTLRLGSGGVMLPNHSPLAVAEQFGMLEALHPGRIDLGLGRAPGTDGLAAAALRRGRTMDGDDDFPRQLAELVGYFDGTSFREVHPFGSIHATPARGYSPDIWLLGSSDFSAHLAGELGLPFSFAHHFAAGNTMAAVRVYRAAFRPSRVLERPYLSLGVNVVCAADDEHAQWLAGSGALAIVRLRQGRPDVYPTPEEAAAHEYTPMEREIVRGWTSAHIVGSPETVRAGLLGLAAETGADELMITTMIHSPDERLESYRLVAEAMDLQPSDAASMLNR
ncbi:MAG: LLM class flavin-dependent oxidoreductase [Ilumatobacteraceae bacterium]